MVHVERFGNYELSSDFFFCRILGEKEEEGMEGRGGEGRGEGRGGEGEVGEREKEERGRGEDVRKNLQL